MKIEEYGRSLRLIEEYRDRSNSYLKWVAGMSPAAFFTYFAKQILKERENTLSSKGEKNTI